MIRSFIIVALLALAACGTIPPAIVASTAPDVQVKHETVVIPEHCAVDPGPAPINPFSDPRLTSGVPFPGAEATLAAAPVGSPASLAAHEQALMNQAARARLLLSDTDLLMADDINVRALLKGCTG